MILVIRTLILYAVVITAMRIMGKRQLGELQPSELVVAILISDLAAVPMESTDIPLMTGIIPVITLISAEIIASQLSLKSKVIRKLLSGEPSVVIYNGHINEGELRRLRLNLDDLLEELRLNNCHDVSDVEVAVIETSGKLSVIPKDAARSVTVEDMKSDKIRHDGLPCTIVSDGKLNQKELDRAGKDMEWLKRKMKKHKISDIKEIFIASLDAEEELFVQLKEKKHT